ncbi:MAG TPA: DUF4282 domain-containing protein [Streptosporangiaceae bacterium]
MANPPYGPGQPGGWQQPGPQPYPPQTHPGYQPPSGPRYDNDRGFFGSLFDFSFDNFIAPKLIKFLYVLLLIIVTILAIVLIIVGLVGLGQGTPAGLLAIVGAPIAWLVYLVIARLALEFYIVIFKISDDLKDIRDSGGGMR